ncbi:unnamed protein product [Phytophthora fragariaefolia]|uniref:Unnamed protein product n=1 Tax=Phytophthora fragariaefolia TaxID=1490495 RepID=A0A9W7CTF5_9STRA|nr:unnamed protein product [Phytophthora fragariaefolia]
MADTREERPHALDGPTEVLTIPGHESRDYLPMRQPPTNETHELWVRRTKELIPKVVEFRSGRPRRLRVANISDRLVTCPVHLLLLLWVPRGDIPRPEGYVRLGRTTYLAAATVSEDWGDRDAISTSEHPGNDIEFEDHARELAFLPDLTEAASTTDYTGPHVRHPSLSVEQQDRVVKVLESHGRILISSGNALPPPAYGVACDIDVQEHLPIKQKARRIPLRHLKQIYELLKGLLKAGLIAFSDSPGASPIVIVLMKNGVDTRLCIAYKMVNSVTAIMEYVMPLVDDSLTNMEKYL